MYRTLVSGTVGIVVLLAACTASPPAPSTSNPVPADQPATSTSDTSTATSPDTGEHHSGEDSATPAAEPTIGSIAGDVDASGGTDEMVDTAPERSPDADDQQFVGDAEADPTPTSELGGDPPSVNQEVDELVDDVDDLLADLEGILGDLDADMADVADGISMNEGDI